MKRIEFFGPIGSGKSTLHTQLLSDKSFVTYSNAREEVYAILLNQIKKTSVLKYNLLKLILHTPIKDRVFSNYDFYHYLKGDKQADTLLNYVLNELKVSEHTDKAKTLVRLNYLLKDLTNHIVLKNHSQKELVIHDESLIQRGVSFAIDGSFDHFATFFDHCVLPDGVIYTSTSLDNLKDRVSLRSKNNFGFYGKKKHPEEEIIKSLLFSEKIYSILTQKKVKILKVDTNTAIQDNVKLISEWIKTI